MTECLYVNGQCSHRECEVWPYDEDRRLGPQPTVADYCAQGQHAYYGDDAGRGRCYCGHVEYPEGGPEPVGDTDGGQD